MPHTVDRAIEIISWLIKQCAPDFSDTFASADPPPTTEIKVGWLRSPYAAVCPLLGIDTSTGEAHALLHAGVLEGPGGCSPVYLRVPRKLAATHLQCYPTYRLSPLGRRWAIAALTIDKPERLKAMLVAAMERPADVETIAATVYPDDKEKAQWCALVLMGAGVTPTTTQVEREAAIDVELITLAL